MNSHTLIITTFSLALTFLVLAIIIIGSHTGFPSVGDVVGANY